MLFVGFYLAALLVATAGPFLAFVGIFHVVDLMWFSLVLPRLYKVPSLSRIAGLYVAFDMITCVGAAPSSDASVKENLAASTTLALIDEQETNGYYHVKDTAGLDGWVYRTMGRRFHGDVPGGTPSGGTAGSGAQPSQPMPNDFAIPPAPAWGMQTKTTNCTSTNGVSDAGCTPGDIIPEENEDLVCSPDFHTGTVRDRTTTTTQKNQVYPHGRPGYVVDHIKLLMCGGADDTSNMQWQTVAGAKAKDKVERKGCH